MRRFFQDIIAKRDAASLTFVAAILLSSFWCLALPLSKSVQTAYLKRFHLRSESYVGWAGQQLTPAMYNLENQYLFSSQPLPESERRTIEHAFYRQLKNRKTRTTEQATASAETHPIRLDMLNHFPTRTMTFVTSRHFLKQQREGYFYFRSRYRDSALESVFHVEPVSDSQSKVTILTPEGGGK